MTLPRRLLGSLLAALALALAAPAAAPLAGERVLWMGDSITQAGHYVTLVEYYLARAFPQEKFDIISIGRSGETVSGLSEASHAYPRPNAHDRLPRALELVRPTVVVACYGMNDGIYHPPSPERLRAFQEGMTRLIERCRAAGARVILLSPPPFDRLPPGRNLQPADAPSFGYSAPFEDYDTVLDSFARWEMSLPESTAAAIDVHTAFNVRLHGLRRAQPDYTFAPDAVHPNELGHLLIAQIVLRGLGVALPPAAKDLPAELARIQADPLFPLIKQRREKRSAAWLAHVGLPGALEAAEADCARLQQQIDALRAP